MITADLQQDMFMFAVEISIRIINFGIYVTPVHRLFQDAAVYSMWRYPILKKNHI